MKLRNKKTGDIGEFDCVGGIRIGWCDEMTEYQQYNSMKELNENWEDYEEPEGWWFIDGDRAYETHCTNSTLRNMTADQELGNYFHYKGEADQAVEKLKAWKRLKDAGAEFYGWRRNQTGTYELYMRWEDRIPRSYEVKNDLDLLFGGEE